MCTMYLCFLLSCVGLVLSSMTPEVVYEWKSVEFEWPSPATKTQYLQNGRYIPNNNIITGIKVWQNTVYVTVPRWREGVPVTLATVSGNLSAPILSAFPNWDIQQLGDCNNIQYTQSMEIDSTGTMWVIDTGLVDLWDPKGANTTCPPKIMLIDIATQQVKDTFVLPGTVAPPGTFLNDIVLNEKTQTAYISDTGYGSIITVDMANKKAYRFHHSSMNGNPLYGTIDFDGYLFNSTAPIDGIAISPDKEYIYYAPLAGLRLHRVNATTLTMSNYAAAQTVENLGMRPSWMDGMVCDSQGKLYYGVQDEYAIYMWDTSFPILTHMNQMKMYNNSYSMEWTDTFAISDNYLYWTTNKLPVFALGRMDFTQINMRVFKMKFMM